MTDAEEFLAHYGIKGMRWGRRKASSTILSSKSSVHEDKDPPHSDALTAQAAKAKAKKSGLDSLSNEEIQKFVTRTNLEQQYTRLTPTQISKGRKIGTNLVNESSNIASNTIKGIAQQYATQYGKKAVDAAIKSGAAAKAAKAAAKAAAAAVG